MTAEVTPDATVSQLIVSTLASSVTRMATYDPGVRLGTDPEALHRFRVATRRLRSNLRSFAPLLEPGWAGGLKGELVWLDSTVGEVRDADVLLSRLSWTAAELPETDRIQADALLRLLADQRQLGRGALLGALGSSRYDALIDLLTGTASDPPLAPAPPGLGTRPARELDVLARAWRRLERAVREVGDEPSDQQLHRLRILTKRCRYTAEALAPVAGQGAGRLATRLAGLQAVLGDHQDTVVAEGWLRDAAGKRPEAALPAGELIMLERLKRARLRREWPKAWQRASSPELQAGLPGWPLGRA